MVEPRQARQLWWGVEPYHAVVYFASDAKEAFEAIGLKGFWMGYFASRAAPLGAVPAEVVIATFYNFHPGMVHRAIPDAWERARPEQITAARLALADRTLRRVLGDDVVYSPEIAEAAGLARRVAEAAPPIGRPLFAAYTALPWPEAPHLVLWHAATLIREHRGDGHIAAMVHADVDACQAHWLTISDGATTREVFELSRRWPEAEWEAARVRLQRRGWLEANATLTQDGVEAKQSLEDRTDELATSPLASLRADEVNRLIGLMQSLGKRVIMAGGMPFPNPMALPNRLAEQS